MALAVAVAALQVVVTLAELEVVQLVVKVMLVEMVEITLVNQVARAEVALVQPARVVVVV